MSRYANKLIDLEIFRHLFIVGFSQLLYSNKTWCSILKDHCGG